MDTMTLTKVAAGVIGAWLVLLLAKWGGEGVYHPHAHGEQSYVIEIEGAEPAEAEAEIPFEELMASASADKGAKVFRKCTACHKVEDGANATGPFLFNVVGRDIGAAAGFSGYSSGLAGKGEAWTIENLNGFLTKPSEWAPGTTMGFAGLKKPEDRANVIAYLQSFSN
ncbi:c-type cytochrome [Sulfitobacter donghicola]|uniref:Cytochrome C n=1 Tax=Sulfitobacter donghicola DSW-25 = KCTC 12864 = JCM 14565 TaxID=1300350 RepID=A0A073IMY1_9RHOB|nr:cytochrome c family protein [Sulfitobacter donghicola]KEJ90935.1 cytochrome C [Sulfitobacter donghicola DSW-25 = KCTC 12864 = JCM 14565]KIN68224.1 Cytochrome c552 [Sulfitobacter donghicola DSW-25 = KCTC 12864 = JCM 14565]